MSQIPIPTVEQRFHNDSKFRNELRKLDLRDRVWEALVKAYRERAKSDGISQVDWAALAGKTPAQVCRMISGPRNLTLDSVSESLSALDMVLDVQVTDVRHLNKGSNTWNASIADEFVTSVQPILAHQKLSSNTSSPNEFVFEVESA